MIQSYISLQYANDVVEKIFMQSDLNDKIIFHLTTRSKTGDKIIELRAEACQAAQDLRAARKSNASRAVQLKIMKLRDDCLTQATTLHNSNFTLLEQVAVNKVSKYRGVKEYLYGYASWRHGEKMHTVHFWEAALE